MTNILRLCFGSETLLTDREDFTNFLKTETKAAFKLPGQRISSFRREVPKSQFSGSSMSDLLLDDQKTLRSKRSEQTESKIFEVVKVKGDSDYFKLIHRRFQAIFQFYIDGASYIDEDWDCHYFICYMDHRVVGFTSVLEDCGTEGWQSSSKNRQSAKKNQKSVLLSQFVILPPYQGLGLGSAILKIVYDHYLNVDKQCVEFTVEEPSDEFQSLMDLIEIKLLWQHGFFSSIKKLFKNKRACHQFINIHNFDQLSLTNDEIARI